jgi:hypothetical protein
MNLMDFTGNWIAEKPDRERLVCWLVLNANTGAFMQAALRELMGTGRLSPAMERSVRNSVARQDREDRRNDMISYRRRDSSAA